MPGEVYSFGINYLFTDGYVSPTFHIPGGNISLDDGTGRGMLNTNMMYHELDGSNTYTDVHNCSSGYYWGQDSTGQNLTNRRVRHHRFPFRKDVGKPLVTRNTVATDITRYRLSLIFTENPASLPDWGSGSGADGVSAVIEFKIDGTTVFTSFSTTLFQSDMGHAIVIYDDTVPLDFILSGQVYQVQVGCELSIFQSGSKPDFLIAQVYDPAGYTVTSIQNTDTAEIFGIEFGNITNPMPGKIVSYQIVRNDRRDDDRIVIDTGLFGTMTENLSFKSFGLLAPKQFYHVSGCNGPADSGKTLHFCKRALWFFNPEYEFYQKKNTFTSLVVEGRYIESKVYLPAMSDRVNPDPSQPDPMCNEGGSRGVYIDDVQAGTTYNPDINKKKTKDDDGFDLIIGYRTTEFNWLSSPQSNDPATVKVPDLEKTLYLSAASYQNYNDITYYNTSVDNKIGMYIGKTDMDSQLLKSPTDENKLVYAAMVKDNTTSYANFISRPYYKEHNNPVDFPDNVNVINGHRVFNGDVEISSASITSSVFYDIVVADRAKKHSLWKIIVGAVLILAAVVLTIATDGAGGFFGWEIAGAGVALIGAVAPLVISLAVSIIGSGIKLDQFKAMVETDYSLGLKDCVVDGGVYECIREGSVNGHGHVVDGVDVNDDTIRWFADRIKSIYMESAVSMGLRSGLTSGTPDFMDAPAVYNEGVFRSYLIEKLTVIDRNQGSGRMYKGFSSAEIYDMNLDYLRHNHEKVYFHLSIEYDCCSDFKEIFPRRVHWSQQSFQEEKIDNYRVFLPNNYADIEGEHGEITGVYRLGNSLYIQTREGTWNLPQNQQERVTNEIVSFIGTGTLFSILPRKIVDVDMGSLGTIHKWANIKTSMGMFSISEPENKIFLHSDSIKEVSADGIMSFTDENVKQFLSEQMHSLGIDFVNTNNPANPYGTGYHSTYDSLFNRVIFTKRDYLLLPDKVDTLIVVSDTPHPGDVDFVYNIRNGIFYQGTTPIPLSNRSYFEDHSFTISFSLNTMKWVSWHSYVPTLYIHFKGRMMAHLADNPSNYYWRHNVEGDYQRYFGVKYPHIIEGALLAERGESIFDDITIKTKALSYSPTNKQFVEKRYITFNKITIYDSIHNSGELYMAVKQDQPNRQDYFSQQTKRTLGQILISRENGSWNINNFRDFVVDYDTPMFTSDWDNIKASYPIDKVITPLVVDFHKDWRFLESFRGKYIVFRLKFDNFDNINLITNYLLSTTNDSF